MDPEQMETLVAAAKSQDSEALGTLCEHFYPKVFRFILHRVNRAEDAEDMASEVCVRVVQSLKHHQGFFPAWIFRIARNLVTDSYRRGAIRNEVTLSDGLIDTVVGPNGPENTPALPHQLERALATLTPEQQEVIHLRFVEGLSAAEIGEVQGRKAGAVRGLQYRALRALGDTLGVAAGE